jgi:glycerate 2-kinase
MQPPAPATDALLAALAAADPARALAHAWNIAGHPPTLLLAFGKSSLEMARAAASLLAQPPVRAIVLAVPERLAHAGSSDGIAAASYPECNLEIHPADHPLPTPRSLHAATIVRDAVARFANEYGPRGRIIALISGGGSAHLSLPARGLTLDDLTALNTLLQRAGASIHELNAVRKHTEQLKGGLLAKLAGQCSVHAFVASDVMGDPLDVIASGPFAPDPTTYADALAIIDRYKLNAQLPRIVDHLRHGTQGHHAETLKPQEASANVHHTIITSNAVALHAAAVSLKASGYHVIITTQEAQSFHARTVGECLAAAALSTHPRGTGVPPVSTDPSSNTSHLHRHNRIAFLWGGEPVVDVRDSQASSSAGNALGGPSQELALAAAIELHEALPTLRAHHASVTLATFSTDGIDGPTPSAGALLTHNAIENLPIQEAREALARHDSHTFLKAQQVLLTPGPTGLNVNHLAMILIDR